MYSQTLQTQTINFFKGNIMGALKNSNGKFGACIKLRGKFLVIECEYKQETRYESISKMINDGWVID